MGLNYRLMSCAIYPSLRSDGQLVLRRNDSAKCSAVFTEFNGNEEKKCATTSVYVLARRDEFVTSVRAVLLNVSFGDLSEKTVNGESYRNVWSGYSLPPLLVFTNLFVEAMPQTCALAVYHYLIKRLLNISEISETTLISPKPRISLYRSSHLCRYLSLATVHCKSVN